MNLKNIWKKVTKNNQDVSFVEVIIFIFSLIGVAIIICNDIDKEWHGRLISFILSFIISWFLSKLANNKMLKEEQKKFASIAYRHGKNLSTKMEISAEKYKFSYSNSCFKKESCVFYKNMNEIIEDLLIFKNDTEENIEDFSRYIGNDIIKLEKIEEYDTELKKLYSNLQDENNDKIDLIESRIKLIESKRDHEFDEITEELKVHYLKRKKRNQDLEKIIQNRINSEQTIINDKDIEAKMGDMLRDKYIQRNMTNPV